MKNYPILHIDFPEVREEDLYKEMKRLAKSPWSSQDHNTHGKPAGNEHFYFHHDAVGDDPSCTLCIARSESNRWTVTGIILGKGQMKEIPLERYSYMLTDFDLNIAEPAAKTVEGMTSIDINTFRLEDYFSPKAVKLLKRFCELANHCDLGHHPSDQKRWNSFLIQVFDDDNDITSCDTFGECLKTAQWWPDEGMPNLVHEYDFAMRLLEQSGQNNT